MSSRAIRRLMKEHGVDDLAEVTKRLDAAEAAAKEKATNIDDNETEQNVESKKKVNPFDLLMGDDGASESDSDSASTGQGAVVEPVKHVVKKTADMASATKASGKSNGGGKKKGKGKAKKGKGVDRNAQADNEMTMAELDAELEAIQRQDEIDKQEAERVGNSKAQQGGKGQAIGVLLTDEQQRNRALLVADSKHMDSQAEIRRMFGSAALKDDTPVRGRGRGRVVQGNGLKRMSLACPKAAWPPMRASPGVEMRQLDAESSVDARMRTRIESDPTGGTWFALSHSTRFRTIQMEFLAAVMSHNPDAIAAIVYQHPYHVDALLQLSEILKQTGGDFSEAGELVERALYAFEAGFAPRFNATNGMGRLDFRFVESRGLFLALCRHMQFMARRGCWRTAFEVNKVLLSLDPVQDPYGALLTLDFYALKSRQYEYVRRFVADWSWSSLELPNWAYSGALAEYMIEAQASKKHKQADAMQMARSRSVDMLADAILTFPTAVPLLVSKANIDIDAVVLTHPYFQDEQIPDRSELTHMQLAVQLFVERQASLYRAPEVGRWVQEGLLLALERIASADDASDGDDAAMSRKLAAQSRLCTYVIPENISRHVLVADIEAIKAGLPEEIRTAESFAFDPLPPADDVNIYNDIVHIGGGAVRGERMPGAFEFDDEELDLGDIGPEQMNFIQRVLHGMRGLVPAGADDPGTSDDDEPVESGDEAR